MKKIILLAVVLFMSSLLHAQTAKQVTVSSTGTTVKMICAPIKWTEIDKSDSTLLLEGKCISAGLTWGVRYIDLGTSKVGEDNTIEEFLKYMLADERELTYNCKMTILYNVQQLNNGSLATIKDVWEDYDGNWYHVKGYTNGRVLAILYVKKKGKFAITPAIQEFLDSFVFGK